jgi:hypothetical protein
MTLRIKKEEREGRRKGQAKEKRKNRGGRNGEISLFFILVITYYIYCPAFCIFHSIYVNEIASNHYMKLLITV